MTISPKLAILSAAALLALSGCGNAAEDETATTEETTAAGQPGTAVTVALQDAEGTEVGTAQFSEAQAGTQLALQVEGMEAGFYGFHIHGAGLCETDSAAPDDPGETGDFLSAGGHLGAEEAEHPDHAGDLPSLHVMADGRGSLMTTTDRFTLEELTGDEDGSAVMIHSGPDNFANIPERYAPEGPDEETLSTGDAGSRLACGVIE